MGRPINKHLWYRGTLDIPADEPGGFDISAVHHENGVRLWLGGLVHDCDTADEGLAWVERAASRAYRLRIDMRGETAYQWTLEDAQSGQGVMASGHGPLLPAIRKKTVYRQNRRD